MRTNTAEIHKESKTSKLSKIEIQLSHLNGTKCFTMHIGQIRLNINYTTIVFFANLFAATTGTNTRNATFKIVHSVLLHQ